MLMGIRNVAFTDHAWEDFLYFEETDKRMFRKIKSLVKDTMRNPFEGEGKVEKLKGANNQDLFSRRINDKDRLVYEVLNDRILIHQMRGHYTDK